MKKFGVKVVYFEVDNWYCGSDYPNTPTFIKWMSNDLKLQFNNDSWCKENHLCVYAKCVDMSQDFTVSATEDWVKENCPELLNNEDCKKFVKGISDDLDDIPDAKFGVFREYCEENFGSKVDPTYDDYWDWEDEDEEDNDDNNE